MLPLHSVVLSRVPVMMHMIMRERVYNRTAIACRKACRPPPCWPVRIGIASI